MDYLDHKRYHWVGRIKLFLLFFTVLLGFLKAQYAFAGPQLHCSFSPNSVPVGGRVSAFCTAASGYGFFQCPFGQKVTTVTLYFHYDKPTGEVRFVQSGICNSALCTITIPASGFNEIGQWYITGCLDRHCSFPADDDSYCPPGYWGPINVVGGTCGDGIVNQPSEQCDDGNTVSGDGCDANCQIEIGPSAPTLPTSYDNPLRWNTILEFLSYILRMLFWAAIIILFFVLLIAAYYIITSGGSSTRILTAKKIFLWAFVGFVIIILGRIIIWLIQHL